MDFKTRATKLNKNRIRQIRTVMDKTGWSAYTAFININTMRTGSDPITYKEYAQEKMWKDFRNKETKKILKYMETGKAPKKPIVNITEEEFNDIFYTDEQKFAIEDIKKGIITYKTLANFLGIEFPSECMESNENIYKKIATVNSSVKEGCVFFAVKALTPEKVEAVCKNKPAFVIGYKRDMEEYSKYGIPFIACRSVLSYVIDMTSIIRKCYDLTSIGISGSVGKTTTTEMIGCVAENYKNTYRVRGNHNTNRHACQFTFDLSDDYGIWIQEGSGARPGLLESGSRVVCPDIFVVTNVGNGHIGFFEGKQENLMYEKIALDRQAAPNALGVINWDDPLLKKVPYLHKVVGFAIHDENADYFAANIVESADQLSFVVREKDGTETPVTLNVVGQHNILNALAAFAVGVQLGEDRQRIAESLESYKPTGIRQNFIWLGGRHLYLDCYSATENSMRTAMETLGSLEVPEGGRRIAVVADIPDLKEETDIIHHRVGKMIGEVATADEVLFYGTSMALAEEEAVALGVKCRRTTELAELEQWVRDYDDKDVICFKASHKMELARIVDNIFGTNFYPNDLESANATKKAVVGTMAFKCIENYGAVITRENKTLESSTIPAEVNGYITCGINEAAYKNSAIKSIDIPSSVKSIGDEAFFNCSSLESIKLPESLLYVGNYAFYGCKALTEVEIPEGVLTIGENAFKNTNIEKIIIPSSVKTISNTAFDKDSKVVVVCPAGSVAESWCKANGISVETK